MSRLIGATCPEQSSFRRCLYVFLRPIYTEDVPGVARRNPLFVILRSCTTTPGRNKTKKESCAATGNFSV